jgi:hypothetical protein
VFPFPGYVPPPSWTPRPTWTPGPSPTPWPTATPLPTYTPRPTPTLAPTSAEPYTDQPFYFVFVRGGQLWLTEIGGAGERQLTHEEWTIDRDYGYAMAPDCRHVAYVPWADSQMPDALIKQVNITDGFISVLAGADDANLEIGPSWLDDTHLAYSVSEYQAAGHGYSVAVNPDSSFRSQRARPEHGREHTYRRVAPPFSIAGRALLVDRHLRVRLRVRI